MRSRSRNLPVGGKELIDVTFNQNIIISEMGNIMLYSVAHADWVIFPFGRTVPNVGG